MHVPELSAPDGGAAPVLLLHGQPGVGADWGPIVSLLEEDHLVLAPDRPGYGAAPGPALGPTGNADVAAEALAQLDAPAVVVGHSYGAAVALSVAERHHDLVAALVLLCPAGSPRSLNAVDRALAWPGVGEGAAWLLMQASAAVPLVLPLLARSSRLPVLPSVLAWRRSDSWRSFTVEQRALVSELPELVRELPSVSCPVEIVAGRRDRVVPPAAVRQLARALPGAGVTWVPDAGHMLPWEQPELVAAVIARAAGPRETDP